jgi:hypothetical protein
MGSKVRLEWMSDNRLITGSATNNFLKSGKFLFKKRGKLWKKLLMEWR